MAFEFWVGGRLHGAGISSALDAIDKPFKAWALSHVGALVRAFGNQGHEDRGGPGWPAWSQAYDQRQTRRGRATMLVDTGLLRNSISSLAGRMAVRRAGVALGVSFGTHISYGKYHQSLEPRNVMPWRPFLYVTRTDREGLRALLKGYLLDAVGQRRYRHAS